MILTYFYLSMVLMQDFDLLWNKYLYFVRVLILLPALVLTSPFYNVLLVNLLHLLLDKKPPYSDKP